MISGVLVVHNEEKSIKRALESMKGVVDEIIVVHDGPCDDKTLEICSMFGAKTFIRPQQRNAEPHRPWSYQKAKGPWILQLDADEYLSKGLIDAIPKLIKNKNVAIYELEWPSWDGTRYITTGWPHKKALFRKDKVNFLGLPHCEVVATVGQVCKVPYVLEHKPNYNNFTWASFRKKWLSWAKIHANWILKDKSTYSYWPKINTNLLPKYYIIRRHPYIFSLPLGIYQGINSYISGGYKMGLNGLKVSGMIFCYWLSVGYFVITNSS